MDPYDCFSFDKGTAVEVTGAMQAVRRLPPETIRRKVDNQVIDVKYRERKGKRPLLTAYSKIDILSVTNPPNSTDHSTEERKVYFTYFNVDYRIGSLSEMCFS